MIFTTIRMKVFPEKRKELFQTLKSLVSSIRSQKGCRRCEFCVSAEEQNEFCLIGEWENREELDLHLRSELFKILLGAMSLLKNPHEMNLYTDLSAPQSPELTGEVNAPQSNT
jgi:quinol monooxygenase YgiN